MGRLRQVPKAEATPEVAKIYQEMFGERDPVAEPGTVIGSPGDYWTTLALVPDLLVSAYGSLFTMLQPGRKLPPQLRELAILRTAISGDSKSEYTQHLKIARSVGVPEEKLAAIKGWTTSDLYTPAERAVMAAIDEMLSRNLIEDATFAALKRHLADPEIVELLIVSGLWRMHGMIVRVLHAEYDTDTTARMEEVPAPEAK